ncbi:hypothetical protein BJV82DRAFT_709694 [Fennellomyces sp. T-0311]|nr:hypothetical protein BJV82DRAFT_709694 [Fennellomyces sp. T-0311]
MFTLPSDIVIEIVSYFSQQDCLTCMAVCRNWYETIPQYTQSVWKEVILDERYLSRTHHRRERCLGDHVESVIIRSTEEQARQAHLYMLIQLLLDCGCSGIRSLELICWNMNDEDKLLGLLRQLAPKLTHLKLAKAHFSISPLSLFDIYPELTHFTCHECNFFPSNDYGHILRSSESTVDRPTKITHLLLDVRMDKKHIKCILKKCPNLRSLIGVSEATMSRRLSRLPDSSISNELDSIFSLCPRIGFLATDSCYTSIHWFKDNPDDYLSDQAGLRYFRIIGCYGLDQIGRHLTKNQVTLEALSIIRFDLQWSAMFVSLQMPNLRTLSLINHRCSPGSLIAMLNRCPALEKLDLQHRLQSLHWNIPTNQRQLPLFMVLEQCPVLEQLVIAARDEFLMLPNGFMGLRQLKSLEADVNSWSMHMRDQHTPERKAVVAQFFKHLADNSKLEKIKFSNISTLGYETLRTVATMPTLRIIDVHLDPYLADNELEEFIRMLQETAIESLTLRNARQFTFSVLNSLSELPRLAQFSSQWAWNDSVDTMVSKEGLLQMLRNSQSLAVLSFSIPIIIVENDKSILTRDQVVELVHEQTSQYDIPSVTSRWDIQTSNYISLDRELYNVTIHRINT